MRLDKWLWAARFYKTRQLAVEAINGGKVHLNGNRTKPGKNIDIGTRLEIHKGALSWDISIEQVPKQRRPAKEAVLFYSESEESKNNRQQMIETLQLQKAAQPLMTKSRPNKKDRRLIHRFKQGNT